MRLPARAVCRSVLWVVAACVLAAAVLITMTRLVEPQLGLAIQMQAFTPFAIPLYAAALLLLVGYGAAVRVRRRRWRTVAWPLAVLALAGVVLHGWWFAPMLTGEAPEAAEDADRTTVLTVNLFVGRGDAETLMDLVRANGVDLLVASEITASAVQALEAHGVSEALPHRAGRPDPGDARAGTMVFAREPAELLTEVDTVMDTLLVAVGDLQVLAVHPSPPIYPDRWSDDHAAVVEATLEHRPDLVAGDFNATNDHGPLRALRDAGYRDAIELTNGGFQPTWPNVGGVGLIGAVGFFGPVAQVDHVLVDEQHAVLETSTRSLDGSDHKLVLATVARRPAGG